MNHTFNPVRRLTGCARGLVARKHGFDKFAVLSILLWCDHVVAIESVDSGPSCGILSVRGAFDLHNIETLSVEKLFDFRYHNSQDLRREFYGWD